MHGYLSTPSNTLANTEVFLHVHRLNMKWSVLFLLSDQTIPVLQMIHKRSYTVYITSMSLISFFSFRAVIQCSLVERKQFLDETA